MTQLRLVFSFLQEKNVSFFPFFLNGFKLIGLKWFSPMCFCHFLWRQSSSLELRVTEIRNQNDKVDSFQPDFIVCFISAHNKCVCDWQSVRAARLLEFLTTQKMCECKVKANQVLVCRDWHMQSFACMCQLRLFSAPCRFKFPECHNTMLKDWCTAWLKTLFGELKIQHKSLFLCFLSLKQSNFPTCSYQSQHNMTVRSLKISVLLSQQCMD